MNPQTPLRLQINAYDPGGAPSHGLVDLRSPGVKRYALATPGQPPQALLAPAAELDFTDWAHPDVGWGLITSAALTTLPKSLQALVAHRKGMVLHYLPDWERRHTFLRNPTLGRDVAIAGSSCGVGPGRLPYYLLIYGGPEQVPWGIQYALAATRAVGRLPLEGTALDNYVNALLADFKDDAADPYTAVTWGVDTDPDDITHLMRTHLAAKVHAEFLRDSEMGSERSVFLDGLADPAAATVGRLIDTLARRRPGIVVTTSHGLTGPLDDVERMRATLGLPVDQAHAALDPKALLAKWRPAGAVWYCHACCSAGAEAPSYFAELFDQGSELRPILDGIARSGSMVAPMPIALLGHTRPARAFIGHVEPTFDWTLRNPGNRQVQTASFVGAIYPNLFQTKPPTPVGHAFREVHRNVGGYLAAWDVAKGVYNTGTRNVTDLLAMKLCARDLASLVVLGDPAAMLSLRQDS